MMKTLTLDLVDLLATCQSEFMRTLRTLEDVFRFSEAPILLTGAVGVGKATVARRFGEVAGTFVEVDGYALDGASWEDWRQEIASARGGALFVNGLELLGTAQQVCLLRTLEREPTVRLVATMNGTEKPTGIHAGLWAWASSWTFTFPQFAQRVEDWSLMLDRAVREWEGRRIGKKLEFQESARQKYLRFAASPEAVWSGNGHDLRSSATRLATLAEIGKKDSEKILTVTVEMATEEISRLKTLWAGETPVVRTVAESSGTALEDARFARQVLGAERWATLDRFSRVQLADALAVCRKTENISEAGRVLFSSSRLEKKTSNDADRLRKYLLKFGISMSDVQDMVRAEDRD